MNVGVNEIYLYDKTILMGIIVVVEEMEEMRKLLEWQVTAPTAETVGKLRRWEVMLREVKDGGQEQAEMNKLRAKYKTLYGRKPFGAWTKEQLVEKINDKNR